MNHKVANQEKCSNDETENLLGMSGFSTFFRDVHGVDPFPWQERLALRVLSNNDWPSVINLPTGTGKTAVLDIAIYAIAVNPRISPRRIVFVVDRRIVVDQVFKRAQKISNKIKSGETEILWKVRNQMNNLCPVEGLGVTALRGGIPIDGEWAFRPDQPWVMVSTVDQYGSRLLFRGYGVSPGMRPIHAGLAGNDCLVILDEVHLSIPFKETLHQVDQWETNRIHRRFKVVQMSATHTEDSSKSFGLLSEDLRCSDELRKRVTASKRAKLEFVKNTEDIPSKTRKLIESIRKTDLHVSCVGVIVNRVRTARETYKLLSDAGYLTHLVTGRMRPLDRLEIIQSIESAADPDRVRHIDSNEFSIVVATQAIEVGADLDFDALITECSSYDSLQQRFGRFDRRGKLSDTGSAPNIWILGAKSIAKSKSPDPIYGESLKATWCKLESMQDESGIIDVGWQTVTKKLSECAYSIPDVAPVILKTHMDALVQTRPEPIVQSSIEWFLHGMNHQNSEPEVSIVWRWDCSPDGLKEVPPRGAEFIQVPISAIKSWLMQEQEVDISDTTRTFPGKKKQTDASRDFTDRVIRCVRWQSSKRTGVSVEKVEDVQDICPGDVLIVSPADGGIGAGTWDPSSNEKVEDLGDHAQLSYGRRTTLRLHPNLIDCSSMPPTPTEEETSDIPIKNRILDWLKLRQEGEIDLESHWMYTAIDRLLENGFEFIRIQEHADFNDLGEYYVLVERQENSDKQKIDESQLDSSDELVSMTGTETTLEKHLEGVGWRAKQIATRLGLPQDLADDLSLAGRLHDIGKIDARFQEMLVGGDPVELELRRMKPLAKSLPSAHTRGCHNYPRNMRHEISSLAMIESNLDVIIHANDPDLVLHLIGTHHGWGRPLLPVIDDPNPQQLIYSVDGKRMEASSDLVDSALPVCMAERFWALTERYGYYGLAWIESILRLADHQQSAYEGRL